MKKAQTIISYLYLLVGIYLIYEGFQNWTQNQQRAYLLFGMGALAVFMFFLKKRMLKKYR